MTCEQTEQVLAAVENAVHDAAPTIDELSGAVVAATGSWAGDPVMEAFGGRWPRWRQALPLAGMRGLVCFGQNRGRKTTYTAPTATGTVPADPVAWLLGRHLHAFGPSAPARFANWLNVPGAWARDVSSRPTCHAYAVGNDRARLNPGVAATRARGKFQVLLADGVVGGLWHQKRAGTKVALTVEPSSA